MDKKRRFSVAYFLLALLAVAALQDYMAYMAPGRVNDLPYNDFKVLLHAGKIASVEVVTP